MTPALLLLVLVGISVNYFMEFNLLKRKYYKPTAYLSLNNIFLTVKYSFIFFSLGGVLSVQNSRVYNYIVSSDHKLSNLKEYTSFTHMISLCLLSIAIFYSSQMSTDKIMFRVLKDVIEKRYSGEDEKVQGRSQKDYYF